jgi:hypothetical protein
MTAERLVDRVRAAFADRDRDRRPARIDELAARSTLYPPARTIDVAQRTPSPLTTHAPSVAEPGGARDAREQVLLDARDSTE